ncbi:hypothetical protein N7452_003663 [Penicillium brevicompactum]|uniref:Uncharacterized protein n=1 Tax=Penicillium brevicompactum TaxID=5074 RepID=A0A9W9QVH7_PENBR|nr:hypothetical protein N7452_003663 [Penicillium brevicompactum]
MKGSNEDGNLADIIHVQALHKATFSGGSRLNKFRRGDNQARIPTPEEDPCGGFPAIEIIRGGCSWNPSYAEHLIELLPQAAAAAANSEERMAELFKLCFNLHGYLSRIQTPKQELEWQIWMAMER